MTFSPTPPTVAGAYWWRANKDSTIDLIWVTPDDLTDKANFSGLWSPRLVSVDLLKAAHIEGQDAAWVSAGFIYMESKLQIDNWNKSHARKVVEGEGE
jgi:hypothetical protein